MKHLLYFSILLTLAYPVRAQSLVDVVNESAQQNANLPRSARRTITNAELEKFRTVGNVTSGDLPKAEERSKTESRKENEENNKWRNKIIAVENRIEALKLKITVYDEQIQTLNGSILLRNYPGCYTNFMRVLDLKERKAKAEADLKSAVEEKSQIEEEARRTGILPGVLRGQTF